MDIDKILDVIKRKVLKGTYLPLTIKKIQAGYLTSLYLKVKVLLLYSATQLNLTVSVALYNLTPGRGLNQPWCEPSP